MIPLSHNSTSASVSRELTSALKWIDQRGFPARLSVITSMQSRATGAMHSRAMRRLEMLDTVTSRKHLSRVSSQGTHPPSSYSSFPAVDGSADKRVAHDAAVLAPCERNMGFFVSYLPTFFQSFRFRVCASISTYTLNQPSCSCSSLLVRPQRVSPCLDMRGGWCFVSGQLASKRALPDRQDVTRGRPFQGIALAVYSSSWSRQRIASSCTLAYPVTLDSCGDDEAPVQYVAYPARVPVLVPPARRPRLGIAACQC